MAKELEDFLESTFNFGEEDVQNEEDLFFDQEILKDLENALTLHDNLQPDEQSTSPSSSVPDPVVSGFDEFLAGEHNPKDIPVLFPPPKLPSNLSAVYKCGVCNDKAGKHIHYGGRTCPSCRAFFRRAVQSNFYQTFRCNFEKNCEINIVTRKDCQYCRYQKCLTAGMKPSYVLTERKNKRKSKQPTEESSSQKEEIEEIQRNDDIEQIMVYPGSQHGPIMKLTNEDIMTIKLLIDTEQQINYQRLIQHSNVGSFLARFAYTGEFFYSQDIRKAFKQWTTENNIFKILGILDFKSIPEHDQNELLRLNLIHVKIVNVASALEELDFGLYQDVHTITKSGEVEQYEELRQDLEKLGITNKPRIAYKNMYPSPWLASYAEEVRHWELFMKLKSFVKPPGHCQPDGALTALGRCIVALDSESANLRRPDLVEKLQLKYMNIMRIYLLAKYKDVQQAMDQFTEGMKVISYARVAADLERRRQLLV